VFVVGPADGRMDVEPVSNDGDLAEGNAGLRHAEGAGIHAEEEDLFGGSGVTFEVYFGGFCGVDEGVVYVGYGGRERENLNGTGEICGYFGWIH